MRPLQNRLPRLTTWNPRLPHTFLPLLRLTRPAARPLTCAPFPVGVIYALTLVNIFVSLAALAQASADRLPAVKSKAGQSRPPHYGLRDP